MTIEEIKAYLAEHAEDVEVKAFLQEIAPTNELTAEKVLEYLKSDDGKLIVQPMIDQKVTQAVKTRDKAHEQVFETEVKKRVAAEVLKLNPAEEPWQKEMRELREENEKERAERAKENLKRQIVEKAASMQVPTFFIEDYMPDSVESGELFLKKIKDFSDNLVKGTTEKVIAESGYKPKGGVDLKKNKVDLGKLTQAEAIALEMKGELDGQINS